MGLLDDLLGQLAAGAAPQNRPAQQPQAAGGLDMSRILMALMPVVLAMLGSRRSAQSAGFDRGGNSGGGLTDILGQVLGGAMGGGRGGGGLGGLGAILGQLQRSGFGEQASSWVGTGRNLPLPPGALEQIFGAGGLAEIARRAGLTQEETAQGLSQLMPEVVDRVTPNGDVPGDDDLLQGVEALARRFGI
jgi:uncharacterized protein YidB (DUF937 family)